MREIKFRGFAVEKMVDGQWQYGSGVTHMEFAEDYAQEVGRKADWYVWTESGWVRVHEQSIGQYTGLKDENGVEIYEGDVVNVNKPWIKPRIEVVDFYTVGGMAGVHPFTDTEHQWTSYTAEVIGNVYEHPHLLNQ